MTDYKTTSKSFHFMEITDPVVISESQTTRRVIFVGINDTKTESGETVKITLVHQRKNKNDIWENVKSINLNTLKGGEGIRLRFDSEETKKLFDKLNEFYSISQQKGIIQGTNFLTVSKADEIIRVDSDRKVLIEKLLSENYGEEIWNDLLETNPSLATKLSLAKIQSNRTAILEEFKDNIDKGNNDESFWQDFFMNNDWIFGYGLNYQFLHIIDEQSNYGGQDFTGKGGQKGDYLASTLAETKFTVLVEIKTPATRLFTYKSTGNLNEYRNGVGLLSKEIIGGVSQLQINCKTWAENSQNKLNVKKLENQNIYTVAPKGILVIGNSVELNKNENKINTFEQYRRNLQNPRVLTFDELYERAKFIVHTGELETDQITKPNNDDLPF